MCPYFYSNFESCPKDYGLITEKDRRFIVNKNKVFRAKVKFNLVNMCYKCGKYFALTIK